MTVILIEIGSNLGVSSMSLRYQIAEKSTGGPQPSLLSKNFGIFFTKKAVFGQF